MQRFLPEISLTPRFRGYHNVGRGDLIGMDRQPEFANTWPLDSDSAFTLVARVLADIDRGSDERREALLADMLCAAWPTRVAQDH
jgi:hypothetical protein